MLAVNVHQLKNNPSEAFRREKGAPAIVLKGDRPTAIMLTLDDDASQNDPDVKLALATELFTCGHLSLGQAARRAERPTVEFMQHLSERDIAVIQGAPKGAKADLETLRKWAVSS